MFRFASRLPPACVGDAWGIFGEETAAISLDREVFEGGIAHEDGAITLQLGGVEFVIARASDGYCGRRPEANLPRQGLAAPCQPLEDDLDRRAALLRVASRDAFAHLADLGGE